MKATGKIAVAILAVTAFFSFFAPYITPHDPNRIDLESIREAPGSRHLLGTDNKGRDLFARILYGGRVSIGVAVIAGSLSMVIGLVAGLFSGYFGGRVDTAVMAFVDLILSFPALLLAIGISVVFPPGIYTVMIAIAAVSWAPFARIIRGNVLILKEAHFIEAAHSIGCSRLRILFAHLMPQCFPVLLVMAGMKMGGYILTEAALSFLGLGVQPPTATWGSMINANRAYITSAPWMVFYPGLMIALTALCFNMLGDALRDKYGLKMRG